MPPADAETCPRCGGVGFVYPTLPEGHVDFAEAVPCTCTQQELEGNRLARLQRYSNLGPLLEMTFESTSSLGRSEARANQEHYARALEHARAYAMDPQGWFVITGSAGSGKTRIAAAIANAAIARGRPALFVVVPDLLDHLRATYSPQSSATYDELFEQVRDAPLLVLDDLGAQSTTPWAQEKLFQLLNHRYSSRLSTVVTVSGPLESVDERLRHRLTDPAVAQLVSLEEHEDLLVPYRGALSMGLLAWMTFEHFDQRPPNTTGEQHVSLRTALQEASKFARYPDGWLVLTGPAGCGKTHLAAAIANYRLAQGDPVFFAVVPDLLDHLRAAYSPDSGVAFDTLFEMVRKTPLLILDDLGVQTASPWAEEKLFQLINHRYNDLLPTVVTSGLDMDEIADVAPAIASRLSHKGFSNVVPMDAPDYRGSGQAARGRSGRGPRRGRTRSPR